MARTRTVTSSKGRSTSSTRGKKGRPTKTTSRKSRKTSEKTKNTSSGPTATESVSARRRWWALLDLCGVLGSAYVVAALATWTPGDAGFSRVGAVETHNAAGPVGAWLADFLLQTVGYGAWAMLLLGAAFVIRLSGRRLFGVSAAFAAIGLFWAGLCALYLVLPARSGMEFPTGGMVGLVSAEALRGQFGDAGAWIGLSGVTAVSLTVGLGVDWQSMFDRAASGVESGVPRVAGAGKSLGHRAAARANGIREAAASLFSRSERDTYTDEHTGAWDDETGSWVDETGSWVDETGVAGSVASSRLSERPAASVFVEEVASAEPPPRSAPAPARRKSSRRSGRIPARPIDLHEEPSLGPLPRPTLRPPEAKGQAKGTVSPTAVADRELVEVEWEPTAAPIVAHAGRTSAPRDSFSARQAPPPSPVRATVADEQWSRPVLESAAPLRPSFPDAFHTPPPQDDFDRAQPTRPSLAPPPSVPSVVRPPTPAVQRLAPTPAAPVAVAPGALVSGGDDHGGVLIDARDDISFELPHLGLLDKHQRSVAQFDEIGLHALALKLTAKLEDFGVKGEVTAIRPGPVITTFEYLPSAGIKLSKIKTLEDDIAMALCALRVRIVAPIPGKGVVGFEVPNEKRLTVWIRDILASDTFRGKERALPMALGKNVEGMPLVGDLSKAPHLLVAGTTGSGKSVGVNAMLMSMLYTRTPEELRLILIDPKMLEFELYQDIPHLLHPVVTDPALASAALKWVCGEMDRRYHVLARWKTRNISSYNKKVKEALADWNPRTARKHAPKNWPSSEPPPPPRPLPYIVVVIDELADLMMIAAKDVEVSIARVAQKARAAGIHLIVATQRPEKTVVTGIIKANLPSRIAFQVRSKLDGRIILDTSGAEALLGKGDMLYLPPGTSELVRCQSPFVDDEEVRRVTDHLRAQGAPVYEAEIKVDEGGEGSDDEIEYDDLYDLAVAYVVEQGKASTSMIQRQFKIGYNRAARMIEVMEKEGVVGAADGARPRKILVGGHAG